MHSNETLTFNFVCNVASYSGRKLQARPSRSNDLRRYGEEYEQHLLLSLRISAHLFSIQQRMKFFTHSNFNRTSWSINQILAPYLNLERRYGEERTSKMRKILLFEAVKGCDERLKNQIPLQAHFGSLKNLYTKFQPYSSIRRRDK